MRVGKGTSQWKSERLKKEIPQPDPLVSWSKQEPLGWLGEMAPILGRDNEERCAKPVRVRSHWNSCPILNEVFTLLKSLQAAPLPVAPLAAGGVLVAFPAFPGGWHSALPRRLRQAANFTFLHFTDVVGFYTSKTSSTRETITTKSWQSLHCDGLEPNLQDLWGT